MKATWKSENLTAKAKFWIDYNAYVFFPILFDFSFGFGSYIIDFWPQSNKTYNRLKE